MRSEKFSSLIPQKMLIGHGPLLKPSSNAAYPFGLTSLTCNPVNLGVMLL
jgi:hypothetical protein